MKRFLPLILLCVGCSTGDKGPSQVVPSKGPTTEQIASSALSSDPKLRIEQIVTRQLAGKNNRGRDYLIEVRVLPNETKAADGKDDYLLVVKFSADDNLTKNMIKLGMQRKMGSLYKALFSSDNRVAMASVSAFFSLTDKYGNTTEDLAYRTLLSDDEGRRVNWALDEPTLFLRILPGVWSDSFVHPALQ